MSAERLWAVVPAAGDGRRFGEAAPKQYLPVAGRTVLEWALEPLLAIPAIQGLALPLAAGDERWAALPLAAEPRIHPCAGGRSRQESVCHGLDALLALGAGPRDPVLVHDAARPCLRRDDILRLLEAVAGSEEGGLLALPVRDTLKRGDGAGQVAETLPREGLWQALTPQVFPLGRLRAALERPGPPVTDEAQAMERCGARPRLVEGSADNLKLTFAADVAFVEAILAARHRQEERP